MLKRLIAGDKFIELGQEAQKLYKDKSQRKNYDKISEEDLDYLDSTFKSVLYKPALYMLPVAIIAYFGLYRRTRTSLFKNPIAIETQDYKKQVSSVKKHAMISLLGFGWSSLTLAYAVKYDLVKTEYFLKYQNLIEAYLKQRDDEILRNAIKRRNNKTDYEDK